MPWHDSFESLELVFLSSILGTGRGYFQEVARQASRQAEGTFNSSLCHDPWEFNKDGCSLTAVIGLFGAGLRFCSFECLQHRKPLRGQFVL